MQAPRFWYRPPGPLARLLFPLGWLYGRATARRQKQETDAFRPAPPVICVGNINVGGTGKTPTVIALAERLGAHTHVVSRGYGGRLEGPLRVDECRHDASDVGDEPLLLSAFAPVWVANQRRDGAQEAAVDARYLILDDGFQDPTIAKDISIIVVDAARGFGNGYCLPAGPLRETINAGLSRADLLLTIGDRAAQDHFDTLWPEAAHLPRLRGALTPLETGMDWKGLPLFAFAGIGHPDKFFATLRQLGADLKHGEALADHQPLTEALLNRLLRDARAAGAQLVTTEKDAVRLPAEWRRQVLTLPVRLIVEDWSAFDRLRASL